MMKYFIANHQKQIYNLHKLLINFVTVKIFVQKKILALHVINYNKGCDVVIDPFLNEQ